MTSNPKNFIQLYIKGEPIIEFGPVFSKDLAFETLKKYKVEFSLDENGFPLKEGKEYSIIGGGRAIENHGKTIFYKESIYGTPNKEHLKKSGKNLDDFIFRI